jgi:hypothetical protein
MNVQRQIVRVGGALVAFLCLGYSPAARADTWYNFNYTVVTNNGGGSDYSGQLDVSGSTIISITGESSAYGEITGLLPMNSYGDNNNDFTPTVPYLDYYGVSFTVAGHGDSNLYSESLGGFDGFWDEYNNSFDLNNSPGSPPNSIGILTLTPVPEPFTVSIFSAGLAALSLARMAQRRGTRQTVILR